MNMLCLDRPLPAATPERYQPYLHEEIRHIWGLCKKGVVRDIDFRQDRPGVAVFFECETTDEARQIFSEFPLFKAGLIECDVIPLGPFVNWELLFVQDGK